MSVHLSSLAWEIQFPTHTQKLIMLKITDHANDDGVSVFPSVAQLADSANCKKRVVQYALRALESANLIERVHTGGHGPGDTNKWVINVELLCQLATRESVLRGATDCLEVVENKGANIAPSHMTRVQRAILRVHGNAQKGAPECTRTTTNHQLEPPTRAGAREGDDFDLGKSEDVPAATPAIHLKPKSVGWDAWIDWLRARSENDLADMAETSREIAVPSRWPKLDSPLPRVSKRTGLSPTSKRQTGEHVE